MGDLKRLLGIDLSLQDLSFAMQDPWGGLKKNKVFAGKSSPFLPGIIYY